MESTTKAIEEENTQKICLEKSVLAKTKKQEVTTCQSILYKVLPDEEVEPSDPDFEEVSRNNGLHIRLNKIRNEKLLKSLKCLKVFDIVWLILGGIDSKNRRFVLNFLQSSFPNKIKELDFRSSGQMDLKRCNYLNSLTRLTSKVVRLVHFERFSIGLPQLKRLVAAFKHVRTLGLISCRLSIPSVTDLSKALKNCQIQKIDLNGSGDSDCSDWDNNFDEFENLVQGLASSPDLRLSLEKVDVTECGVTQNKVEQVFEENQLGEVNIIDHMLNLV
ncbi:unnamed protein product [Moneuplotes crassus]|uniref:Uncharacterized protein n=1 Tax=Euplotes crassus TaxID=5936 RepID=A0AAD1UTN2_EUPCR|nr:unnamed protein product [Moneuplotes crassus]